MVEPIQELRWRVAKDGLYQAIDGGPFKRVATRFHIVSALYAAGMLVSHVSDDHRPQLNAMLEPRPRVSRDPLQLTRDCIGILQSKLRDRIEIIDVNRPAKVNPLSVAQARGFKLPIRGLGTVFAVKPAYLRRWLPGTMPLERFLDALDERGWLLHGADGTRTRQIVIPGYARFRFYCLKLEAAGRHGDDEDVADVEFPDNGLDRAANAVGTRI